jgi:hypothetical protein
MKLLLLQLLCHPPLILWREGFMSYIVLCVKAGPSRTYGALIAVAPSRNIEIATFREHAKLSVNVL